MLNAGVQRGNRLFYRDNIGKLKESALHNHVGSFAKPQLLRNAQGVNGIKFDVVGCNITLHGRRQFLFQFSVLPFAVQQECAAGL